MRRQKLNIILISAFILTIILIILIFPSDVVLAAQNALNLCYTAILPSLFPFFVFSGLLIATGVTDIASKRLRFIMKPLFGVSGAGAICFILGIVSGYPLGAICANDLYKQGITTKEESENLLAFCNNSGPLFILGTVGTAIYHSQNLGWILYITHIFAAICVGIIFRFRKCGNSNSDKVSAMSVHNVNLGKAIGTVMQRSVKNILMICGFTVVFAVIISCISKLGGTFANPLFSGILEISNGISHIAASDYDYMYKIVLTSFVLGFGGISVHIQVLGVLSDSHLSFKPYIIGKILQGILCAVFTYSALVFIGGDIDVFAGEMYPAAACALTFWGALKISAMFLLICVVSIFIMLKISKDE